MTDREKVIKGLIACTSDDSQAEDEWHDCENCPYGDICATTYTGIGIPVMLDALAMLKEQEAKPVEVCGQMFTIKYGHCPTCGKGIDSEAYPHWCGFCGQAVKWECSCSKS